MDGRFVLGFGFFFLFSLIVGVFVFCYGNNNVWYNFLSVLKVMWGLNIDIYNRKLDK